jgi:hypothetical protein
VSGHRVAYHRISTYQVMLLLALLIKNDEKVWTVAD